MQQTRLSRRVFVKRAGCAAVLGWGTGQPGNKRPNGGGDFPERSVLSIAHRGGIVSGTPENTLAAFRQAVASGADVLEIDLRSTKDGAIVILHDPTLDRTTNGKGQVIDYRLDELKQLDAGNGERIPTYEEVLQFAARTSVKLLLDIKVSPVLNKRQVVRLTEHYRLVLDTIVGVRTLEDLKEFKSLNPNLRTLGFVPSVAQIGRFAGAGADIIRLWPDWILDDPGLVDRVHRLGRPVWVTTSANSSAELEQIIGSGVNGILADSPALMAKVLADTEHRRRD